MCGFFFFKQKTAYEMRISDWSSDVCSSDLATNDIERDVVNGVNAKRVLHGDRGDRRRRITAKRGDRLDVGLKPRAAATIGSGNDENAASGIDHMKIGGHQAAQLSMAEQISPTTARTSFSSSPSPMTRMSGSVPDLRMPRRPVLPRRASPPLI